MKLILKNSILIAIIVITLEACGDDSGSSSFSNETSQGFPLCEKCEYGLLTDTRDGQKYRTVKIGTQWWMAENLNYAYNQRTAELDSSSVCIENDSENCKKYGRFYMWSAAMDSAGLFSSKSLGCGTDNVKCERAYPVRGVCPEGWHLPSNAEVEALFAAVGGFLGKNEDGDPAWKNAASKLTICNDQDLYGFAAVSSNKRGHGTVCSNKGDYMMECAKTIAYFQMDKKYEDMYKNSASFWTSSLDSGKNDELASFFNLRCYDDYARFLGAETASAYIDEHRVINVRCVKD